MNSSAKIDSRLILECLTSAGLSESSGAALAADLAALVTGRTAGSVSRSATFIVNGNSSSAVLSLELLWDGVMLRVEFESGLDLRAALAKYSQNFDEAIQQKLKFLTGHALLALDARLKSIGAPLDDLRRGTKSIDATVARELISFYLNCVDRVIHEEIAALLVKPVREKSVRVELGQFVLSQFVVPAKRVQRFTLCQALENLAEPELADGLTTLALDPQYNSLRGRLCMALAKTKAPNCAATILRVLEDGDDETKMWALESLGALKTAECSDQIEKFRTYQSADKEWTRAINKAAEKALKALAR